MDLSLFEWTDTSPEPDQVECTMALTEGKSLKSEHFSNFGDKAKKTFSLYHWEGQLYWIEFNEKYLSCRKIHAGQPLDK